MEDIKKVIVKYPLFILILTGFILYFYSLFNYFIGDDFDQLVRNIFIHSPAHIPYFFLGSTFNNGFSTLAGMYYKPMMTIIFSLLYFFFKATPFFYHLTQLSFHIGNTILVYILFKKLFPQLVSWCGALIFLLHPINSEAVVYISGLQDVLFAFFGLLGMVITIYKPVSTKILFGIYSLVLLSLLSKETGILFIGTILAYTLLFQRKQLLKHVPFSITTFILYLLLRMHAVGVYNYHNELFPMMHLTLSQRLLQMPSIILYYVKTAFFPYPLVFDQNWVIKSITFQSFIIPAFIILTLASLLGLCMYNNRTNKRYFSLLVFFSTWTVLGLFLHLQILPLDTTVADRWFYFPIIGVIGLLITLYEEYLRDKNLQKLSMYTFSSVICIFFVMTLLRSLNWQNQLTLYEHDVKFNQDSFSLLNGYASELMNVGKYEEAESYIKQSINLEPNFCYSWNNLGSVYAKKKEYTKARSYYEEAIKRRDCVLAYDNLGTLMAYHFPLDEAYIFLINALKKVPNSPRLWLMFALVEEKQGKHEKAILAAKKSYQLDKSQDAAYVYISLINQKSINISDQ